MINDLDEKIKKKSKKKLLKKFSCNGASVKILDNKNKLVLEAELKNDKDDSTLYNGENQEDFEISLT